MAKLTKSEKKQLKKARTINKLQNPTAPTEVVSYNLTHVFEFLKANVLFCGVLALIVFAVYFRMLFASFVSADDLAGYVNNPEIRQITINNKSPNINYLYYSIMYFLFQTNAAALHFGSIFLHIVITILVLVFTYLLFGKKISLYSTLLFAVHPVNSETVSWISGHGYLFVTLMHLPILILYLLFRRSQKVIYLILSLAVFTFAVFINKHPWSTVIVGVVCLIEFFILEEKIRLKSIQRVSPFILISIPASVFIFYEAAKQRLTVLKTVYDFNHTEATPLLQRIPYTVYKTVYLLIFPRKLSIFHEGENISIYFYLYMIILTITSVALIFFLLKFKTRKGAGLIMMIFASILPVFSPIQVGFFIAERYLYFASIFFCLLIVITIEKIEAAYNKKNILTWMILILFTVYSVRTFIRTGDWQNSKALWEATSKVAVNSPRVYNNLGDAYANEQNYPASIASFQKAIELNPTYVDATHNLANTYLQAGQYDLASELFKKALELNPEYEGAERAKTVLEALQNRNLNTDGQE